MDAAWGFFKGKGVGAAAWAILLFVPKKGTRYGLQLRAEVLPPSRTQGESRLGKTGENLIKCGLFLNIFY